MLPMITVQGKVTMVLGSLLGEYYRHDYSCKRVMNEVGGLGLGLGLGLRLGLGLGLGFG